MITRINESGLLIKHISCDCKCKFDGSKHNLNQKWNKPKCKCEFKNPINHCLCWNRSICSYESNEYLKNYVSLKSHIDDSVFFLW